MSDAVAPGQKIERTLNACGGRLFAAALIVSIIFAGMLFTVRAEKIFTLPPSIMESSAEDLRVFWRAGQMALDGEGVSIYDRDVLSAQFPENGKGLIWLNPPHALFAVLPLGLMSYGAAKALWLIASAIGFVLIARIGAPQSPALMAASLIGPASFASFLVLQAGPFMALLLMGGLLLAERRPILAGFLLALLTFKPQYGLMAPLFLAVRGDWRAFASAAAFTCLMAFSSLLAFGADSWRAFFSVVTGDHAMNIHRDMVTAGQAAGKLGAGADLRAIVQAAAILIGAGATIAAARRLPRGEATAVVLLASAAAAPSFWVYDWAFVAAALYLLTRNGRWPLSIQTIAAAALFAPLIPLGAETQLSSVATTALIFASLVAVSIWHLARNLGFRFAKEEFLSRGALRLPSRKRERAFSQTRSGPTRTTALPKFSPWKSPIKAFGASSIPE